MSDNRIKFRDFDNGGATVSVKGEYTAKLVFVGSNKIDVIKLINEDSDMTLNRAKEIVDNSPSVIKSNITEYEAREIKTKLENLGAVVEIEKEGQRCKVTVERTVEIIRKKQLNGGGAKIRMFIDGNAYADLYCGDTVKLKQNVGRYMTFRFDAGDGSHWSEEYAIPTDDSNHRYQLYVKSGLLSVKVRLEEI